MQFWAKACEGSHFMNDTNIITRVTTTIQYAITVMYGVCACCFHYAYWMFTSNTMQWHMHNRSKMGNGWNNFYRSTEHINLGARLMYTLSRGHNRITDTRDWGKYDLHMIWLTAVLPTSWDTVYIRLEVRALLSNPWRALRRLSGSLVWEEVDFVIA